MTRRLFGGTVVIWIMLVGTAMGQPQPPDTQWTRVLGGDGTDVCYSVQQTSDEGCILTGLSFSFGGTAFLIKTDANGDSLWCRTLGGSSWITPYSVQQTSDGGYLLAGYFGEGISFDWWMLKTDANGDSQWSRTYGPTTSNDYCFSAKQSSDGGYILCGTIDPSNTHITIGWLMKTDSLGDSLWTRTFNGQGICECVEVCETSDGSYIVAGSTGFTIDGFTDLWCAKIDANGGSVWTRTFGGSNSELCYGVQVTDDGDYALAGLTYSFGNGGADFWLVKTNANGDSLWSRTYGDGYPNVCKSIQQTTDGGYVLAGQTGIPWDILLVRVDAYGDSLWSLSFGGDLNDFCYSVDLTTDGGYVAGGSVQGVGEGGHDIFLVRLSPELAATELHLTTPRIFAFSTYPNPFNAVTTIEFALPKSMRVTIRAHDVLGREAGILADDVFAAGQHSVSWNCADCASGVYFITMSGKGFHLTRKAIFLR